MRKLLPKLLTLLFVISTSCLLNAQKTKTTALPRYSPKYSYEPPRRDSVASANVTIALMKPIFLLGDYNGNNEEPYNLFSSKMANDIEALLTAKGYKVRGPFSSRDEMIAIDYNAEGQRTWKERYNILGRSYNYEVINGNVNITAAVVITARSNFSGEKLWKKNLDLGTKTFSYSGTMRWDSKSVPFRRELTEDNNFWNPYTKQLESVYSDALTILWRQFDVNELQSVAKEAKKEKQNNKN